MVMFDWENERKSQAYRFTINPKNQWDMDALAALRKRVKSFNDLNGITGPNRFRVCLRPRLGKDNPNAYKYRARRSWQMIRLEDAAHVDVYIYRTGGGY